MLLSMTRFGEAAGQSDHLAAAVEVRAVNNRYLKVSIRCSDGCPTLEPQVEAFIRERVKRGTNVGTEPMRFPWNR